MSRKTSPLRGALWLGLALAAAGLPGEEPPAGPAAAADANAYVIRLVADLESGRLASDLESLTPITTTVFNGEGSSVQTLGERCVLWVRNAHVDGKHFFERYYQGKYIGRRSQLEIPAAELAEGPHTLEPGGHRFERLADGSLRSDDPNVRIVGRELRLRLFPVQVKAVDAARAGPADFRLVPADLGVVSLAPAFRVDAANLPQKGAFFDPQHPPEAGQPIPPLTNLLSHQKSFYPLTVWLPANEAGQGYLLYPAWQAFHLSPQGEVRLSAAEAPRVAGLSASSAEIVVPYHRFTGKVTSINNLQGGVGTVPLSEKMSLSSTLEPVRFRAGFGKPEEEFFLPIDGDFTRRPFKHFVADNTLGEKDQIRMLALEWDRPVFTRGAEAKLALRLLGSPSAPPWEPKLVMSVSPYRPHLPTARDWRPVETLGWTNGREAGELRFRAPDAAFGFYVFRVQLFDPAQQALTTPLVAEIPAAIVEPGQSGSLSFSANRGRDAFVVGEEIRLTAVFRSEAPRAAGERTLTLEFPDGTEETLPIADPGDAWHAPTVLLPAERTGRFPPGRYRLAARDLPKGIAVLPFEFDLAPREKPSLFHVVKTSKYTGPMNELERSHLQEKPIDLERAMETIERLGFTRVDLMSYMTNHHLRAYTWREELSGLDPRLPAPEAVYAANAREQMLNACVRRQLQFADVWLSYGDFHLPRQIEPYLQACERWMARETQAMRHSPAFDGMMLYDEMYQIATTGIVKEHPKYFAAYRGRLAEKQLGQTPAKIEEAFNRWLERPRSQRDPAALEKFLTYQNWQQASWGEFAARMVAVGKELLPRARFGTYHRTWLLPGANDDIYHGYPPDLFAPLDIISHVHYADNSTCWVSIPLLAQALRTGQGKTLYVNMPLTHEVRTRWDGQYQRQMAFAMLAQGANGVAQWGTPHTFADGPNPGTAQAYETTAVLNREMLRPFGEIIDRTRDAHQPIGIVSTVRQHSLSGFKQPPVSNQTEGLWIACWRLGYPARFLREEHLGESWEGLKVIFVPGVRFEWELAEPVVQKLREAIAGGVKVVVERDSALELPGIVKWADFPLDSYYVGNYFPTWLDDELNKVYEKSQPIVDYLGPKFAEWKIEPAARGPFRVGPNWRDGGELHYLVMANFNDPDYGHTVKQQMAQPLKLPLTAAARHGRAAYDLLAGRELEVRAAAEGEIGFTLDMTRMQGALVAFAPEPLAGLEVQSRRAEDGSLVELSGALRTASGRTLDAVFPARITLIDGARRRTIERVLGRGIRVSLDLPAAPQARTYTIEVREALRGETATLAVQGGVRPTANLRLLPPDEVHVPYPADVARFFKNLKQAALVPGPGVPGAREVAEELAQRLRDRGVTARIVDEAAAWRVPQGDPQAEDPLGDGFHSWRNGQEAIAPAVVVDEPVIVLGGAGSSFLLDTLAECGYLSERPLGRPGQRAAPTVQVARRGLHYAHDALCLVAQDGAGLRAAMEAALAPATAPIASSPAALTAGPAAQGAGRTARPAATSFLGTNEMATDVQFDAAGNLYVATWGHGKNLYSFTPQGEPRFSRHLPEMGGERLAVHDDRVLFYTAAGAKLYRLSLDGQPRTQARLNLDPGPAYSCDDYSLSSIDFAFLPEKQWLLHNLGDEMRVYDDEYRVVASWRGEPYQDKDVSDEILRRQTRAYVLSPDRQTVAQLETSMYYTKSDYLDLEVFDTHLVLRDLTGKLLAEFKNIDNHAQPAAHAPERARLSWPAGAAGPVIHVKGERWAFDAALQAPQIRSYAIGQYVLGGDRQLLRDGATLVYFDALGQAKSRLGPFAVLPTLAQLDGTGTRLLLVDEDGLATLWNLADGARVAEFRLPQRAAVVRFTADGQRIVVGGYRGGLACFDLAGQTLWERELAEYNDVLGRVLPRHDPAFVDYTDRIWPTSRDAAGELEGLVRLGEDRLQNGDAEQDAGWQGEAVAYQAGGKDSPRALRVGSTFVHQEASGFLGEHATWVLEFFYRAATPDARPTLLAGVRSEAAFPDSVARRFVADDAWRFGRVAIKSGRQCQKLGVAFAAEGGEALVDGARLRRLRFPSVNHLHYEPLHGVQPVVLENPLYSSRYDPLGTVRDENPNRVLIEILTTGVLNLVESAFLQNGRLNDVGSRWFVQPRMQGPMISLGLKEPRWVSLVALHFNAYDEAHVTPHFDIFATDLETKQDRLVASVRHNGQNFRLVKFPPIKTPLVKIKLVNSIARHRTLTEVELYGPLSGREGPPAFLDPQGQNTWMGDFSRVDKRVLALPERGWLPPLVKQGGHDEQVNFFAPLAQPLVADQLLVLGRTFGKNSAHDLADPNKELYLTRVNGLGFTPFGTLYAGLLLRPGNDGKLYCLNPETGAELWSTSLGERLHGAPVCVGEDVFMAGDDGKLYQLDLASGGVLREAPLTGLVLGALATNGQRIVFITDDGVLHCLKVADLEEVWKVSLAEFTDSTPAIDGGFVYCADQRGVARALSLETGQEAWRQELGDEFMRCPVVTKEHVIFGCRGGTLAALARATGEKLWSRRVQSRFYYEPLPIGDKVLYFDGPAALLARLNNGAPTPLQFAPPAPPNQPPQPKDFAPGEPAAPLAWRDGTLVVIPRTDHAEFRVNYPWHVVGGTFVVLKPTPPPAEPAPGAKP